MCQECREEEDKEHLDGMWQCMSVARGRSSGFIYKVTSQSVINSGRERNGCYKEGAEMLGICCVTVRFVYNIDCPDSDGRYI